MGTSISKHETAIDFEALKVKEAIKIFIELGLGSDSLEKSTKDIFGNYVITVF